MLPATDTPLPRTIGEWQHTVAEAFLPLSLQDGGRAFDMRARLAHLGSLRVAEINCSGHRAIRSKRQAEQSEAACYKVIWQITGQCQVEQNGRSVTLLPDHWLIYDAARPYTVECSDRAEFVALLSPAEDDLGWRQFTVANGGIAERTRGTSRLALHTLKDALQHHAELDADSVHGVESAARALLASTFRQRSRDFALAGGGRQARMLVEAQAYIDQHSADPALTPDHLAKSLHVSRRTLYNLFGTHGATPHSCIMGARLEACRAVLANTAQAHKSISQIADEHGFSDSAHFSRVFKHRFGLSPSAYRQRGA